MNTKSGFIGKKLNSYDEFILPVKNVDVVCFVNNSMARITSTLKYENSQDEALETAFIFPLDVNSAIYEFEAKIDDRIIKAKIQEREEANATYERAIESGATGILLSMDERSGDLFEINLGNLPGHKQAIIHFSYCIELSKITVNSSQSALSLRIPSSIHPRYDPDPSKCTFQNGILLTNNKYQFTFTASVQGSMSISHIEGELHHFQVDFINSNRCEANVTLKDVKECFDDVILNIYYAHEGIPHILYERGDQMTKCASQEHNNLIKTDAVMLNFLPSFDNVTPGEAVIEALEYVFVIDQSGSMSGTSMNKAKDTLLLMLKSLPLNCYFQVVGFGSSFTSLFPVPQQYSEDNVTIAVERVNGMQADMGGTEILSPLQTIYSKTLSPGTLKRCIFLITDGEVTNVNEIISLVKKQKTNSLVFSVGIGSGASTALVKGISDASGGRCEFITSNDDNFSSKILNLLRCARQPMVKNIQLDVKLPNGIAAITIPKIINSFYDNEYLTLFLLLQGDLNKLDTEKGTATLKCEYQGKTKEYSLTFCRTDDNCLRPDVSSDGPIHRLAAKYEIQSSTEEEKDKEKIIAISRTFNILSPFTSFVGVDDSMEVVDTKKAVRLLPSVPPSGALLASMVYAQRRSTQLSNDLRAQSLQVDSIDGTAFHHQSKSSKSSSLFRMPNFSLFSKKKKSSPQVQHDSMRSRPIPNSMDINKKLHKGGGGGQQSFDDIADFSMPPTSMLRCANPEASSMDMYKSMQSSMRSGDDDEFEPRAFALVTDSSSSSFSRKQKSQSKNIVVTIANEQKFNGSWQDNEEIWKIIQVDKQKATLLKPENWSWNEFVTLLVIVFLQHFYSHKKGEWEMLVEKAITWLKLSQADSLDELMKHIVGQKNSLFP